MNRQARALAATVPLGALVAATYGYAITRLAFDITRRVRAEFLFTVADGWRWPGVPE